MNLFVPSDETKGDVAKRLRAENLAQSAVKPEGDVELMELIGEEDLSGYLEEMAMTSVWAALSGEQPAASAAKRS